MDRTRKKLMISVFVLLFFLTNLPLIRVICIHEPSTILSIIGHAPSQFLFLALFFPVAVWSTFKIVDLTVTLKYNCPALSNTKFWRWLVKRGLILVFSFIIGIGFASFDKSFTPPDFYQKERKVAQKAAKLNKQFIVILSKATTNKEREKLISENQRDRETLQHYYTVSKNDRVMIIFEFIELAVVGFIVSLMLWMIYLNLKVLNFSRLPEVDDCRENLKREMDRVIPYGVVAIIAYLFWPPLRLYNIYEISEVIAYPTLNPIYVYVFVATQSSALIWLYYSRIDSKLISNITAIVSFLASGALMGFAQVTPQSLVDHLGSGMGFGNLFFLTFSIIVFYLFAFEILRQIRNIRETHNS